MTLGAGSDWNIRLQAAQRSGFGDVDMTGRTFRDVRLLLTAAVVYELRRNPFRR